jgi:hypothetical protein
MDTMSFGRRAAAGAVVLGALTFTVADVLRRSVEPGVATPGSLTGAVAAHPGAWLAAGALSAVTTFLLVPGLVMVLQRAIGRGAALIRVGALLTGVGTLASLVHATGYFGMYGVYARADLDPSVVRSMDAAAESYPLLAVFIGLFMVGMLLGPLLLALGLRRARLVPVWAPVAALVFVVSGATSGLAAGVVGVVAAAALFVAVGRVVAGRLDALPAPVPQPV